MKRIATCALMVMLSSPLPARAGGDEDRNDVARCTVPAYIYSGFVTCYLRTDLGNAGWLVDRSGTTDECQYRCYGTPPNLPPYQFDDFQHGLSWMQCPGGKSYVPGAAGLDCVSINAE